jgi:hypothetical protein
VAKNLPGLVIKIGANTKDAIDGLNKVNRAVGQSASGAGKLQAQWRKAAPALGAAAAAAGALAVAIGVQAVRAAAEEEQAVARLNTTLGNLGFSAASEQVATFIDDMQFATGIADNDLRPAFDRLVRSTGNVAEAQRALSIAADVAVAKNRSVTQVADIMGKAYDGNTMALGRLGVGLDKAILKSGDMQAITTGLADLFGGQAAAAADTMAGKLAILSIAADELSESLGKGIMTGFFDGLSDGTGSIEEVSTRLREMQTNVESIGTTVGTAMALAASGFSTFIDVVKSVTTEAYYRVVGLELGIKSFALEVMDALNIVGDEEAAMVRQQIELARSANDAAYEQQILAIHVKDTAVAAEAADTATSGYTGALSAQEQQAKKTKTALQRLQEQMDKYARNRTIAGQRLNMRQTRAEGPGKGENLREFGLGYADQAAQLAQDIFERGGKGSRGRARRVLANAREYLGSLGLGSNFTDANGAFLGTPNELRRGNPQQRAASAATGGAPGSVNYNFGGDIIVQAQMPQQAVQQAKEWARLTAAGRGVGPAAPVGALG